MSDDLLPCPFCGGKAVAFSYIIEGSVQCSDCRAAITRGHKHTSETGYDEAIAAWNRRAIPATEARADALREAAAVVDDKLMRMGFPSTDGCYRDEMRDAILALIGEAAHD